MVPSSSAVREAWLTSTSTAPVGTPLPGARELISASWWRARSTGLDPDRLLPAVPLDDAALRERRAAHPLAAVLPTARRLLLDEPLGVPVLMAVSDVDGTLLWVEGDGALRRSAERMAFLAGARWSEDAVGTNAPGTALALGRPVRVRSAEHYATAAAGWSCSAAPVRDSATGALLGVLDLTGGDELGRERALELVRAAVGAVEGELRVAALRRRLTAPARPPAPRPRADPPPADAALCVLGGDGVLTVGGRARPLSLRHAELLLVLLADGARRRGAGRSAAALAAALDDRDLAPVSVRAEVHRLRTVLAGCGAGAPGVSAAPYQVLGRLRCDALEVLEALRAGRTAAAVAACTGELLPGSDAPAVRELREELAVGVRTAVLEGDDDAALLRFARGTGRDDPAVAAEVLRRLAPGDPARGEALARARRLGVA